MLKEGRRKIAVSLIIIEGIFFMTRVTKNDRKNKKNIINVTSFTRILPNGDESHKKNNALTFNLDYNVCMWCGVYAEYNIERHKRPLKLKMYICWNHFFPHSFGHGGLVMATQQIHVS